MGRYSYSDLMRFVEEGPPPEVRPLREEPVPVTTTTRPAEIVPIIEHLRSDTVETTQLLAEFDGQRAWVVPTPRYTLRFEIPKWTKIGEYPIREPEEIKRYHESLKWDHPDWEIVRKYERGVNVFYGRPLERKRIHRSDPYLMAREVMALKPKRLAIQHVPRVIIPPRPIKPEELPWGLRLLPPPRYG